MTAVLDVPSWHKQYASSTAISSRGMSKRTSLLPSAMISSAKKYHLRSIRCGTQTGCRLRPVSGGVGAKKENGTCHNRIKKLPTVIGSKRTISNGAGRNGCLGNHAAVCSRGAAVSNATNSIFPPEDLTKRCANLTEGRRCPEAICVKYSMVVPAASATCFAFSRPSASMYVFASIQ